MQSKRMLVNFQSSRSLQFRKFVGLFRLFGKATSFLQPEREGNSIMGCWFGSKAHVTYKTNYAALLLICINSTDLCGGCVQPAGCNWRNSPWSRLESSDSRPFQPKMLPKMSEGKATTESTITFSPNEVIFQVLSTKMSLKVYFVSYNEFM